MQDRINNDVIGDKNMRITTQMLNESARKAGLPVNNTSLLNYINNKGGENSLLEALNKKKETAVTATQKGNYEKLNEEAEQLTQAAEELLKDGENSLFEQAKTSGDNQKVYDSIEKLFSSYNSTLKELKNNSNTLNDFYRKMLAESTTEKEDLLAGIGITFAKDGTAKVDMEKVKASNIETLEEVLGKESELVSKMNFISTAISDNAEANIKSLNSTYNASGSMYSAINSSKYNLWG